MNRKTHISKLEKENKRLRLMLRKFCSKQKFIPVWNGGFSGSIADGGDVSYQCEGCELFCEEISG